MRLLWALLVAIWFFCTTIIVIDILNNPQSVKRLEAAPGAIYPALRQGDKETRRQGDKETRKPMNNSKPGNKLDPALKAIIDPVYNHDKKRYANICRWVWWAQRSGWPDEAIGKAVELAGDNIHKAENWWGLLTQLLPKASGRAHEDEAAAYKKEELNFLNALLGPSWTKKRERDTRRS